MNCTAFGLLAACAIFQLAISSPIASTETNALSTSPECRFNHSGLSGVVTDRNTHSELKDYLVSQNLPLNCTWSIVGKPGHKLYLQHYQSYLPKSVNNCETSYIDFYFGSDETKLNITHAQYCGTGLVPTVYDGNQLDLRFVIAPETLRNNISFVLSFTVFRELANSNESCATDEFNCGDFTCINRALVCDGWTNCRTGDDDNLSTCRPREVGAVELFIINNQELVQVIVLLVGFALLIGLVLAAYCGWRKVCRPQK